MPNYSLKKIPDELYAEIKKYSVAKYQPIRATILKAIETFLRIEK